MNTDRSSRYLRWVVAVVLGLTAVGVSVYLYPKASLSYCNPEYDVYFTYLEGRRIVEGANPYARILNSDMRHNDKYATYLPGGYLLAALTYKMGLREFKEWVDLWAVFYQISHLVLAFLIYREVLRRSSVALAAAAFLFWYFGRFTLYVVYVAQSDGMALCLIFAAISLLPKRPRMACVVFGISLAIKHIGVFLIPLFPLWVFQQSEDKRLRRAVVASVCLLLPPVAVSLPFVVWSPLGFARSMIFHITRLAGGHYGAQSIGDALKLVGVPAKIPMGLLLLLTYFAAIRQQFGRFSQATLIFLILICFHSVLFVQYLCWFVPFLPVALVENRPERQE